MPTKTVATRLPEELLKRLETVAQVDRRSVAQVMALLIERGLPGWEEEIERRALLQRTSSDVPAAEAVSSKRKRSGP